MNAGRILIVVVILLAAGLIATGGYLFVGILSTGSAETGQIALPPVGNAESDLAPRESGEELALRLRGVHRRKLLEEFDLAGLLVDEADLKDGGPGRDGIEAIVNPGHSPITGQQDLNDDARVAVVSIGEETVAYPELILVMHEIVNDVVGGVPIAVAY